MKKLTNIFKIAERIIIGLLILVLILAAMLSVKKFVSKDSVPKLFGYSYLIVVSGSMEPSISVDDLIIIKEEDSYAAGDVITFARSNDLVTHRIEEITDTGYITKGDANNTKDEEIKSEDVKGKVVAKIPKIGLLYRSILSPIGIAIIIALTIIIIAVPMIIKRYKEEKGKKSHENT